MENTWRSTGIFLGNPRQYLQNPKYCYRKGQTGQRMHLLFRKEEGKIASAEKKQFGLFSFLFLWACVGVGGGGTRSCWWIPSSLPPPAFPKTGKREKRESVEKLGFSGCLPSFPLVQLSGGGFFFFFFRKVCAIKIHWLTQKILPFPRFLLLLLFVFEIQAWAVFPLKMHTRFSPMFLAYFILPKKIDHDTETTIALLVVSPIYAFLKNNIFISS